METNSLILTTFDLINLFLVSVWNLRCSKASTSPETFSQRGSGECGPLRYAGDDGGTEIPAKQAQDSAVSQRIVHMWRKECGIVDQSYIVVHSFQSFDLAW
jgi:hypothetical protein